MIKFRQQRINIDGKSIYRDVYELSEGNINNYFIKYKKRWRPVTCIPVTYGECTYNVWRSGEWRQQYY